MTTLTSSVSIVLRPFLIVESKPTLTILRRIHVIDSRLILLLPPLAADIETILNWRESSEQDLEIPFKPARVLLQDFTGVPAVVDLAAMRTAMQELGGDPARINPLCQADLVVDHSIQVDVARTEDAKDRNEEIEFNRNRERFAFLKWGEKAF